MAVEQCKSWNCAVILQLWDAELNAVQVPLDLHLPKRERFNKIKKIKIIKMKINNNCHCINPFISALFQVRYRRVKALTTLIFSQY